MTTVTLTSSDGVDITVDRDVAERSILIKNMLEDLGESDEAIPIPNVNEVVLKKVIEWCTHHKNDPPSTGDDDDSRRKTTDIDEWDQKFMQVDQEMLFEIILAANYLDIKALLDVGCKTVANMIKGKSPKRFVRPSTFRTISLPRRRIKSAVRTSGPRIAKCEPVLTSQNLGLSLWLSRGSHLVTQ
ncbi:SCF ubiquitin ligase subunit skpA [Aspergillus novofumigatus IBT 16806]|uniref:E3 ubiquitin ligase complex SCF subunit sconC n=1 Tax=Aspergillus novofumigatus (strain IBT 16806) TaxID=1392255 RepID=A0A2I1CGQ5_ASPN1|nr:uncharacterized protein P174DRAFT_509964 [Aspergillus novofumigatus IBT 16806]PKX96799.1 hypothetical protein P174DRAFT_509964 [Aspergillus novofumigatus IBT 16806]